MKKFLKFFLLTVVAVTSIQATCGKIKPFSKTPVQKIKIKDYVYFHNVSITYDGNHYFTMNGGNESSCRLNEYDNEGNLVESYDVGLDGRSIFHNPNNDILYVKVYGYDLHEVNLKDQDSRVKLNYVFENDNSSPAASPDCQRLFELVDGEVRVLDFETGEEINSFSIEDYYPEHGYTYAIAASEEYLFIWGAEDRVLVYDHSGEYVTEGVLPWAGYGFSLSFCNSMLWIAKDADASSDGGYGYWYGFRL